MTKPKYYLPSIVHVTVFVSQTAIDSYNFSFERMLKLKLCFVTKRCLIEALFQTSLPALIWNSIKFFGSIRPVGWSYVGVVVIKCNM